MKEAKAAIGKLKNGETLGVCGISAEMMKAKNSVVVKWLHKIISIAWPMGEVPED